MSNQNTCKTFDNTDGTNFKTNTIDAKETIENTGLDQDETIKPLDVKNLHTNVP